MIPKKKKVNDFTAIYNIVAFTIFFRKALVDVGKKTPPLGSHNSELLKEWDLHMKEVVQPIYEQEIEKMMGTEKKEEINNNMYG